MDIKSIDEIVEFYNDLLKPLNKTAMQQTERASGGFLRSEKGKLQESITEYLIRLAWKQVGGNSKHLEISKQKIPIKIKPDYIKTLKDENIINFIKNNATDYNYKLSVDKHVFINGIFVMAVECKSYAENSMLKRICVDFFLLKKQYPDLACYLIQLESMLGGDYSHLNKITYGSKPTHTILSYFPTINLKIITLLKGDRKIKKPIHKPDYFKPLTKEALKYALGELKQDLKNYCG